MAYSSRRILAATTALILGGFAIGVTEFVTMGLLPEIAAGLGLSIPTAGHAISAYAVGVVVGAPIFAVVGARYPRRPMLVALAGLIAAGNIASALAPTYAVLVAARFASGLPHGAFFGVSALVAVAMAREGRAGRSVGRVMLGIPIANVVGVPLATAIGQNLGWRSAYWMVGGLAVLTLLAVLTVVPDTPYDEESTIRSEVGAFLVPQVWLTLLVGAIGFGGTFAMYSYIAPLITDVTRLAPSAVPIYLFAFGLGGVVGTPIGGRLADWSVLRSLVIGSVLSAVLLAAFALVAPWPIPAWIVLFLLSVVVALFVVNMQLRLMQVAGAAKTLGAASVHSALNIANALGAWLGGVVIARGWGYTAPSWVGVGLSLAGLIMLALSVRLHVTARDTPGAQPAG